MCAGVRSCLREQSGEFGKSHQHAHADEDLGRIEQQITLRDEHREHRERGCGREIHLKLTQQPKQKDRAGLSLR